MNVSIAYEHTPKGYGKGMELMKELISVDCGCANLSDGERSSCTWGDRSDAHR